MVNILHFNEAIEVAASLQKDAVVLLALHPGDTTPLRIYEDLVTYAPVSVKVRLVASDVLTAGTMLPGVDAVIESASTIGIQAACLRIPVAESFSLIALNRLEQSTGSRSWPLVGQGVAVLLSDDKRLRDMQFQLLCDKDRRNALLHCAERVYPRPTDPQAPLRAMHQSILSIKTVLT